MAEHTPSPTSDHEVMPHGEYNHDGRLKIVIAGLDKNVRTQAIEAANTRLNEELGEGGFSKKFLRGIWKGNMAREYYLAKYTREAESQIREHENLLEHEGLSAEEYQVATTLRFAHEYDDMLHEGEKRHAVIDRKPDGSVDNEGYELKQHIFRLIEGYAAGSYKTDDDFHEAKKRMMTELVERGLTKDHIGEGLLYTDNLLQIAQNVKAKLEHNLATGEGGGVDDILSNTDIVLGEARLGARTEVEQSRVERLTKKLEGKAFLSDTTVATAVSVAYTMGDWAAKRAVGAAGRMIVPGVGAGVIAGFREKRMLKEERAQHAREMAVGKGDAENLTGRRQELEAARYEAKSASELKDQLGVLYDDEGNLRVGKDTFDEALNMIAECQARIRVSDEMNVDLISFSSVGEVEKERFELDLALAKAKCDMRAFMESATDDELKALGVGDSDIADVRAGNRDALKLVLSGRVDMASGLLIEGGEGYEGIAQKDRIYRKLRNKRVAGAVVKGTLLGMAIGASVQEAAAFASDNQQGYLESSMGLGDPSPDRQTLLEGFSGSTNHSFEMSGQYHEPLSLDRNTKLNLPEEFNLVQDGDRVSINGPEGLHVDDLNLTSDGHFTANSWQRLEAAGFHLSQETDVVSEKVPQEVTISADQLIENHTDDTTKVTRDFWYDNGTANNANGSELGLQPPVTDSDGNFVYSVSGMDAQSATTSNGETISWANTAEKGDLKMALSASDGTQTEVFMVNINEDGQAIIPKDSPAATLFEKNGKDVEFNGKYAEVVEVAGKDENGVTHIRPLATDTGAGAETFKDTVIVTEPHPVTTYTIGYTASSSIDVSVPPVIPIYSRRGIGKLERPTRREAPTISGAPMYGLYGGETSGGEGYGYGGESLFDVWDRERSPRLENDPDHKLDVQEELSWYFDEREGNMDANYIRELDRRIDADPVLDNVPPDIELMVNIPVAAAYEKDNIYNTLSLYAKQDPESLAKTQIVLSLNWKEGVDPNDVEATRAEVERAKVDFPQLNIATFDEVWTKDFVDSRNGKIYGRVVKSLYDTSMRAVERANARNGVKADPLIVTNDADAADISKNYLAQLIKAKYDFPEADVFSAKIHWGTSSFKDYPGFGVVSSFLSLVEDRWRDSYRNKPGGGSWGANSAFRTSALAATGGANGNRGEGVDGEMGRRIYRARVNPTRTERRRSLEPVTGAWIDTAPERQLEAYKNNVLLTDSWADFSSGGYQPRPELAVGSDNEDINRDFDKIKSRIEHQIGGMLSSNWDIGGRDTEVIEAALENIFFKPDGKELWRISGSGDDVQFEFTPEGERELKAVLATIHDTVKEGLSMLDDVYASSRAAAP